MRKCTSRFCMVLFLSLLLFCSFADAQDQLKLVDLRTELETKQKELEAYEPILLDTTLADQTLFETRQSVKVLRERFNEIHEQLKPRSQSIQADITDIGPVPTEDSGKVEPENIKTLREKLNEEALDVEGLLTQADALASKSKRFLERLAAIRRNQFVGKILENNTSLFSVDLWQEAFKGQRQLIVSAKEKLQFLKSESSNSYLSGLMAFVLFCTIVVISVFLFSKRRMKRRLEKIDDPSLKQKLAANGYALFYTMLVAVVGLALFMLFAVEQGVITENNYLFSQKLMLFSLFVVYAITKTWLLASTRTVRRRISLVSLFATLLFAFDFIALEITQYFGVPIEVSVVQSFIVTSVFAGVVLIFFFSLLCEKGEGKVFLVKKRVFYIGILLSVLILVANLLGYVALTRFVFEQMVLLTNYLIAIVLLRAMLSPALMRLEAFFVQGQTSQDHLLLFWLTLILDMFLFILSVPIIAAIIGLEWEGIRLIIYQAISGVEVGGITLSLSGVLSAIILFFVLFFLTRFLQKILGEKVLPKTRMEVSLRQSFVQIVGYVGLTIALMISIAALGFDLSNLALIAGALSVGIGFGLQSIVSNFVSGLILLFERPIKVGDWVIMNSGEGIVKKISVRATEIETFDRTSIIIPNSEFISSSVKNWTHKDRVGRLIITVGVSYNCNPREVRDLLLGVAKENKDVLDNPAPSVNFKDFGDSALIFDLRIFLRNISDIYKVGTDVRMEIWDALKEKDIEIPFPQRDLHLKTPDMIKVQCNEK